MFCFEMVGLFKHKTESESQWDANPCKIDEAKEDVRRNSCEANVLTFTHILAEGCYVVLSYNC